MKVEINGEELEGSITSQVNGHLVEFTEEGHWVYSDTKEFIEIKRPCAYCLKESTKEGHDGCLQTLPGVKFACCGHNIEKPYVILDNDDFKQFETIQELKDYCTVKVLISGPVEYGGVVYRVESEGRIEEDGDTVSTVTVDNIDGDFNVRVLVFNRFIFPIN